MSFTPAGDDDYEETARESRIKIVLLAAALILVGGYAAGLTGMGALLSSLSGILLGSGIAVGAAAAAALVAVAVGVILLLRSRRSRKGTHPRSADATDALAGLADRSGLRETVARHCQAHSRTGRQFAVHVVDIDRFRAVNQAGGEAEGDAFLRSVAERLLVFVKQPDCLARLGDDEFAVVQPEAGSARHAEEFARLLQENLKETCAQVGRHVRPGASIGVAVFPDHGSQPTRLLHSASLAMHSAKRAGGDCFRVYTRDMEMSVEDRLQIEKAIGNGLHEGWFELHFQPLYNLSTRRLTGFEALVRMQHPERGELLPDMFLPAAEESGLMQPWETGSSGRH
jgi:diguanylate cyclase (GGDEF)-like protein